MTPFEDLPEGTTHSYGDGHDHGTPTVPEEYIYHGKLRHPITMTCGQCPQPTVPETEWEERWVKLCNKLAESLDRFSQLQRQGISGTFEIEGKAFIRTTIAEAEERGRQMKGSSWREGYERGRQEALNNHMIISSKDKQPYFIPDDVRKEIVAQAVREVLERLRLKSKLYNDGWSEKEFLGSRGYNNAVADFNKLIAEEAARLDVTPKNEKP